MKNWKVTMVSGQSSPCGKAYARLDVRAKDTTPGEIEQVVQGAVKVRELAAVQTDQINDMRTLLGMQAKLQREVQKERDELRAELEKAREENKPVVDFRLRRQIWQNGRDDGQRSMQRRLDEAHDELHATRAKLAQYKQANKDWTTAYCTVAQELGTLQARLHEILEGGGV